MIDVLLAPIVIFMAIMPFTPTKKSRCLLLKREENLKIEQRFRLLELLRYNLKTIRGPSPCFQ